MVRAQVGFAPTSEVEIYDSVLSEIDWTFSNEALIKNTTIGSFVFKYSNHLPGKRKTAFSGLKPGVPVSFSRDEGVKGRLTFKDTTIKNNWYFNLELPDKDLTIRNSNVRMVWLKIPDTKDRAHIDLPRGLIEDYTIGGDFPEPGLPYQVRLVNTKIQQFKIEPLNGHLEIKNTTAMIHPSGSTDLIINDSIASPLRVYGVDRLKIVNSKIHGPLTFDYRPNYVGGWEIYGMEVGPGGTGEIIFENTVLNSVPYIKVFAKDYRIKGTVKFRDPKTTDKVYWVQGEVTRSYPVIIEDSQGEEASGIDVVLTNNEGKKVWHGTTDESGMVDFDITFNKRNYQNQWGLKAIYPDGRVVKNKVSFLSDTPIHLPPVPDFFVKNLNCKPQKALPGETVRVSFNLVNRGMGKGTYPLKLFVEDKLVEEKEVTLGRKNQKFVTFRTSKEELGSYTVKVDELTQTFHVQDSVSCSFAVVVEREDGTPFSNAPIRLLDSDDNLLWQGKADAQGEVTIPITFHEKSHKNEKKIVTTYPDGNKVVRKFGFSSNLPLTVAPFADPEVVHMRFFKQNIEPGERVEIAISVRNKGGKEAHKFEFTVTGISGIEEDGVWGGLLGQDASFSLTREERKVTISSKNISLEPGQKKTISLAVTFDSEGKHTVTAGDVSKTIEVKSTQD